MACTDSVDFTFLTLDFETRSVKLVKLPPAGGLIGSLTTTPSPPPSTAQ
jgi:hypothetical protein